MEQLSLDRVGRPISQAEPGTEAALALVEEDNDAILVEVVRPAGATGGCAHWSSDDGGHCPKLKLTRKKLARNWARHKSQQLRVQYCGKLGINLADLVFVDETGSNLSMTRRYARALKATAPIAMLPTNAATT